MGTEEAPTYTPGWLSRFTGWLSHPAVSLTLGILSVALLVVFLVLRLARSDVYGAVVAADVDPRAISVAAGLLAAAGFGTYPPSVAPRAVAAGALLGAIGAIGSLLWFVVSVVIALIP